MWKKIFKEEEEAEIDACEYCVFKCARLRARLLEPNGSLAPGGAELSLWGTRAALDDASLACLFSVPAHCPLVTCVCV